MGILDKFLGKEEQREVGNIEEMLEMEGDVVNPPADFYVKKIDLRNEGDAEFAIKELASKNIIIINMMPIAKQPNKRNIIIQKLKSYAMKIDGDIAALTAELVLLTPAKVKIVKSKPKSKA
ncbi:cell division protein SepF [Candidatus Micrarchaeota archaeon]|nr:cell division protein SepF [Candidatus Micrarchaeota archaeon]